MKKLVMVVLGLVMVLMPCIASDYSQEALMKRLQSVQTPEAAGVIFCEFAKKAPDMEFAHQIYRMWNANDPAAADVCLDEMRQDSAAVGRIVYFTGAEKKTLAEKISYSRTIIDDNPDLFEAYALLFDTYTTWLFKQAFQDSPDPASAGFSADDIQQLDSGFQPDNARMVRIREWKNAGQHVDAALKYMGYYAVYKNRYDDAYGHFTEAETRGADWVDYSHIAVVAARLNKLDVTDEYVSKSVNQWMQRGVISAEQREMLMESITMYALVNGGAYDAAIAFIQAREKSMEQPETLFKLAGLYNRKGDTEKAFETLENAVGKGFDNLKALTEADDLKSLHSDARWNTLVRNVQVQWDKGEKDRAEQATAGKIEKNAPEWELKDADGKTYKLSDYKEKKVVILDFWATWCSPCMMVLPDLNEWTKNEKPDNVVVFCINTWERQPDRAKKMFTDSNYAMTLLMNGDDTSRAYGLQGVPYICVIDRDGKIRYELTGYTPDMKKYLTYWVNDLLK